MKKKPDKSVCAIIPSEYRQMLAEILRANGRSVKGQLMVWIKDEYRFVQRGADGR